MDIKDANRSGCTTEKSCLLLFILLGSQVKVGSRDKRKNAYKNLVECAFCVLVSRYVYIKLVRSLLWCFTSIKSNTDYTMRHLTSLSQDRHNRPPFARNLCCWSLMHSSVSIFCRCHLTVSVRPFLSSGFWMRNEAVAADMVFGGFLSKTAINILWIILLI